MADSADLGRRGLGALRLALLSVPVLTLSCGWTLVLADRAETPVPLLLTPVAETVAAPDVDVTVPELPSYLEPVIVASTKQRITPAVRLSMNASTADIPDQALAAYQRAATVINATDSGCRLPWQLLAAIGRVESNHGQFGGSLLDDDGVASPAIVGVALTGSGGTSEVRDTDGGALDGDPRFDRAVGPMQFIPSTWSYVGVDADGDGVRDPQDIDDAALASAVYLCAGPGDLSTDEGQRPAVFRYNHSHSYVDLVLSIRAAYQRGDFWTVPVVDSDTALSVRPATYTPALAPDLPDTPVVVVEHIPHAVASPVGDHSPPDPVDPVDPDDGDPGNGAPGNGDPGNGNPGDDEGEPSDGDGEPGDDGPEDDGGEPGEGENGQPAPQPNPGEEPAEGTGEATVPGEEPAPNEEPSGEPAPDAEPVEAQAARLCTEVGYVDDPELDELTGDTFDVCVAVALELELEDGAAFPTAAELLARLEYDGVALPDLD